MPYPAAANAAIHTALSALGSVSRTIRHTSLRRIVVRADPLTIVSPSSLMASSLPFTDLSSERVATTVIPNELLKANQSSTCYAGVETALTRNAAVNTKRIARSRLTPKTIAQVARIRPTDVFNRCNITSAADKLAALRKTAERLASQPTKK